MTSRTGGWSDGVSNLFVDKKCEEKMENILDISYGHLGRTGGRMDK